MNDSKLRNLLASVMLYGVVLSAAVMLIGGIVYLVQNPDAKPGDHVFHGEPQNLTDPIEIVKAAFAGNVASIIQVGVVLLLLNPLVRVGLAFFGYFAERDRLYAAISAFVFLVLVASYFI